MKISMHLLSLVALLYAAQCSSTVATTEVDMKTRTTEFKKVDNLLLNRWSPRAFDETAVITDEELMTIFEAARWAPSAYNDQPWRFIYAKRGTPQWNPLFDVLVPFNQGWVKDAAVLLVVVSRNTFEPSEKVGDNKPSRTHSFDAGAAWQNLALQAYDLGWVAHGMSGFDYEKAAQAINLPEGWSVEAMVAIGKHQPSKRTEEPSGRKPLSEIVFEGTFSK